MFSLNLPHTHEDTQKRLVQLCDAWNDLTRSNMI